MMDRQLMSAIPVGAGAVLVPLLRRAPRPRITAHFPGA